MALSVQRENLADAGVPPVEAVRVQTSPGTIIEMRPEWQEDKFNQHPASTRVEGNNLDSLLRDEKSAALSAVQGTEEHASHFAIHTKEDIAKVAPNLGIPASDIGRISYTRNAGGVTDMNVTFREGVAPEVIERYNTQLATALERRGIVPAGTTFEMGRAGVASTGQITLDMGHKPGATQPQSLEFTGAQNGTGQGFRVHQNANGSTDIYLGTYEAGRNTMIATREEEVASRQLAAAVGGRVVNGAGESALGINIHIDKPVTEVVAGLEQRGLVDSGLTDQLRAHIATPEGPHATPEPHAQAAPEARVAGGVENRAVAAAERGAVAETSLARRLGGKLGVFAMVAVGGYELISSGPAAAAEMIPGVPQVEAAAQGRPMEAALRTAELSGVGSILTEMVRPIARLAGADVDPGIMESLIPEGDRSQVDPYTRTYEGLNKISPPDPQQHPEVASLFEIRRMIAQTEDKLGQAQRASETRPLQQRVCDLQDRYAEAYEQLDPHQQQLIQEYLADNSHNANSPMSTSIIMQTAYAAPSPRTPGM